MPLTDQQALVAHIRAVESQAKAEVCSVHSAEFASVFEKRFLEWRQTNAEALTRGAAIAEAKGMNSNKPPGGLGAFDRMQAQLLAQLPEGDRQRRCENLLACFIESKAK